MDPRLNWKQAAAKIKSFTVRTYAITDMCIIGMYDCLYGNFINIK